MKRKNLFFGGISGAGLAVAAFTLLAAACLPIFGGLFTAWQTEEYSHGFLIPVIALLLGWHRLSEIKPVLRPSLAGLAVLLAGAVLIVAGRLSAFEPPADYGFLLALTGLILSLFGAATVRALAPALIYLIFAVPLPRLIYVGLSQDLQLWSSSFGVLMLQMLGISVFQDGNIIDLGTAKLQVVEACSGLRYLFPLMSFGFLVACLLDDRWWKRVVVFLSTIPLTVVINSLRIALIGVTVDIWGSGMAEGLLHDLEGWSMFLVCLALLAVECWFLLRIGKGGKFRFHYIGPAQGALATGSVTASGPAIAAFSLCLMLALALGTGWIDQRDEITPPHPPFAEFPQKIGPWTGAAGSFEREVLDTLQVSDYWVGDYTRDGDAAPVNFYMAYYASQRVGSAAHSPANCLPGSGWQVAESHLATLPLGDGATITVSRLLIKKGDARELVYYWFDERGRIMTEQYGAKWYLLRDSIMMHRTDGALVRLVTPLSGSETAIDADARLGAFLKLAYPLIREFIPGPIAP